MGMATGTATGTVIMVMAIMVTAITVMAIMVMATTGTY
jgi:hypothetical protein